MTAAEARAMARANAPDGVRAYLEAIDGAVRAAAAAGGVSCPFPGSYPGLPEPTGPQRDRIESQVKAAGYRLDRSEVQTVRVSGLKSQSHVRVTICWDA